jgi:peptidoglycan/LPS O-acetylase OafA/YrhL
MGTYRFFLAIFVALSHLGITFFAISTGISAVVSFFLLSGFVMTALITKSYSTADRVGAFYLDRAMRLFPQFLLYLVATLAVVLLLKPQSIYLSDLTPVKVALNALMIPLNFFMVGDLMTGMLMPQAWSLGLEAVFYLVIPWLIILKLRVPAFIASAAVFLCAYAGAIDSDTWAYRLLPGSLFIFLLGSFMHGRSPWKRRVLIGSFITSVVLSGVLLANPLLMRIAMLDMLAGIAFGVPMVLLLKDLKLPKIDTHLGNISYGVFLNHFLLIWIFEHFGIRTWGALNTAVLFACSIALAALTYRFIEKPVVDMRHRLRRRLVDESEPETTKFSAPARARAGV